MNITKNSKNLITGIETNNIIKIKYINNIIKDTEGNINMYSIKRESHYVALFLTLRKV